MTGNGTAQNRLHAKGKGEEFTRVNLNRPDKEWGG